METSIKCGYCKHYFNGKSFKDGDIVTRECEPQNKRVKFDSEACK